MNVTTSVQSKLTLMDPQNLHYSRCTDSGHVKLSSSGIVVTDSNADISEMLSRFPGLTRLAILSRIVDEHD